MTADELNELVTDCPTLYHMAQAGSWKSISRRGLLSTSALLDMYDVSADEREAIEHSRRPESVELHSKRYEPAIVRDNKPMTDAGLRKALPPNMSPRDWYSLLNSKVFFWLTKDRLIRLMSAGAYKDQEHDVIMLNTRAIVDDYKKKTWLCPMNSGCTKPFPHPRGPKTFSRISDYPYADWKKKRRVGERAVELCVDGGVFDIEMYLERVVRMKAGIELGQILPEPY